MSTMAAETSKRRRARRRYDDEFKAQAVRLVLDEGQSVTAVARDLDLTRTALHAWVERAQADRSGGKTADDCGARRAGAAAQGTADRRRRARHPKKSHGVFREAEPMRFAFIAAKKAEHTVTILCRCMRVTRSGFYAWVRRGLSGLRAARPDPRTKLRGVAAETGRGDSIRQGSPSSRRLQGPQFNWRIRPRNVTSSSPHAGEDRPGFVGPLVEGGSQSDAVRLSHSEFEMTLGDSLLGKMDEGLRISRYGVAVLSPDFSASRGPGPNWTGLRCARWQKGAR